MHAATISYGHPPANAEAGPSSSPETPRSRLHSSSVSSVHFADLPSRPSAVSLRPTQSRSHLREEVVGSHAGHAESPLHTSSPAPDPSTSKSPPLNGNALGVPSKPLRSTSPDGRRIKSDQGQVRRSDSLIADGKRASMVLGGYESSSTETSSRETSPGRRGSPSRKPPRLGMPTSQSFSGATQGSGTKGRRRAHTLSSRGSGRDEERPRGSGSEVSLDKLRGARRDPMPSRLSSRHPSRDLLKVNVKSPPHLARPATPSRLSSVSSGQAGSGSISRSDSFVKGGSNPPSRTPSKLYPPPQSRVPSTSSVRQKELDRLKREEVVSSPDSGKGKGKERADRRSGLAASLGLGINSRDAVLTPDQIQQLFANDADLTSTIREINSNPLMPMSSRMQPPPPSTTPRPSATTDPPIHELYLPSAPPALYAEPPSLRDRALSVASTIAPSPRSTWQHASGSNETSPRQDSVAERRRRASSRAMSMDFDAGHIPFTHPVQVNEEEEAISEHDEEQQSLAESQPITHIIENGGLSRDTSMRSIAKSGEKKRFSHLFSLKGKKSGSSQSLVKEEPSAEQQAIDQARQAKEELTRQRERERRDAELQQDRRYRALTQIAAHPNSERLAYKTANHFRAFYETIYDGIDNPPRFNPLAVLRWKHKTEEHRRERERYEDRPSNESSRPESRGSSFRLSIHSKRGDQWIQFLSTQDIQDYKDADGVVNYFVPPRSPTPNDSSASVHEKRNTRAITPSPTAQLEDERSQTGSQKPRPPNLQEYPRQRNFSDSVTSFATGDPSIGDPGLSRTTSIEPGRPRSALARRVSSHHRQSQSLGTAHAMAQAIKHKLPIDKFNSVARRHLTAPFHAFGGDQDKDADDFQDYSTSPHREARTAPHSPITSIQRQHRFPIHGSEPSGSVHHSPTVSISGAAGVSKVAPSHLRQSTMPLRQSVTDDERRIHRDVLGHASQLIIRGRKRSLSPEEFKQIAILNSPPSQDGRAARLEELGNAVHREKVFVERQAGGGHKTQAELDATGELQRVEDELYSFRSQKLQLARRRLEHVNGELEIVDDALRHYLRQIDQFKVVTRVSAGVETKWPNIQALEDEYLDTEKPRRTSGLKSETGTPMLNGSMHDSPTSDHRSPRMDYRGDHHAPRGVLVRNNPFSAPSKDGKVRRRSSLAPPSLGLPSVFSFGNPFPRRMVLNSSGTERVDPIQRAELALAEAKDRAGSVDTLKLTATNRIRGMINEVQKMVDRRRKVEKWLADELKDIQALRRDRDGLARPDGWDPLSAIGFTPDRRDLLWNGGLRATVMPTFHTLYYTYDVVMSAIGLKGIAQGQSVLSFRLKRDGGRTIAVLGLIVGIVAWIYNHYK